MTAHIRALFGILGGGALGYIIAICIAELATPLSIGVAVAIVALCVIGIFGCKAVEADGRRKAQRPSNVRIEVVNGYPVRVITKEARRGL